MKRQILVVAILVDFGVVVQLLVQLNMEFVLHLAQESKLVLLGFFGSMTSCTCGGAGAGGLVISEGTYFDDVNLTNLENVLLIIKSKVGFESLSSKLEALIQAIKKNDSNLIPIAQVFFDGLAGLSQEQVATINPELRPLVDACGRE